MVNLIGFCENVTFLKKLINISEGGGWAPEKAIGGIFSTTCFDFSSLAFLLN